MMNDHPKEPIAVIAGQDGSHLAELLLSKGYEVNGIVCRVATEDKARKLKNIAHFLYRIRLHVASLDDVLSLIKAIHQQS